MKCCTTVYRLEKDGQETVFQSEKEACEFLGVARCTVASCYRRSARCKGYRISRLGRSTHGETRTKLHKRWESMIARCEYEKHPYFECYGGRGISVCKEWHDYMAFRKWALSNGYADDLTLDRIDVNGDYEPENCRYVTWEVQGENRRNNHFVQCGSQILTVSKAARMFGIPPSTIRWREAHSRDVLTGAKMDGGEGNGT